MVIFSDSPSTYSKIWDTAVKLYKATFSKIWYLAAIVGFTISISSLASKQAVPSATSKTTWLIIAAAVINIIIGVGVMNIAFHRIYSIGKDQKNAFIDSFGAVIRKYLALIAVAVLTLAATMLGIVALIVPGVFIIVLLQFAQPIVLFENKSVFGSLIDSCKLVWGYWWFTFFVMFPLIAIDYLFRYIINVNFIQNAGVYVSLYVVICAIYYPLFYSLVLVQYNELKLRKSLPPLEAPQAK